MKRLRARFWETAEIADAECTLTDYELQQAEASMVKLVRLWHGGQQPPVTLSCSPLTWKDWNYFGLIMFCALLRLVPCFILEGWCSFCSNKVVLSFCILCFFKNFFYFFNLFYIPRCPLLTLLPVSSFPVSFSPEKESPPTATLHQPSPRSLPE